MFLKEHFSKIAALKGQSPAESRDGFRLAMLATRSVDAAGREHQPCDRLPTYDVRLDDLIDIRFRDVAVPNRFGIDDDVGSVLTLVEAARLVGPDLPFETALGQLLLEQLLQFGFRLRIATATRVSLRTLVPAHENVMFEVGHLDLNEYSRLGLSNQRPANHDQPITTSESRLGNHD